MQNLTRFHMRGCNRLYLLWFSRYFTFKFWSRDYHVIITSPNFFQMVRQTQNLTRFHMCGCNRLYLLWFSRYSTFKFWSRDYHVIMTSHNFSIQPNKRRIYHGFICVVAIGSICHGSLAITLLSFGHVTMTRDNDVTEFFHIPQ